DIEMPRRADASAMSARDVSNDRDASAFARYFTMIRCGGPSASEAAAAPVATRAKQIFEVVRVRRFDLSMGILPGWIRASRHGCRVQIAQGCRATPRMQDEFTVRRWRRMR